MFRQACWIAAIIFMLTGDLLADRGVVVTKSGETYDGDVHEDDQNVTIRIRGIDTVVPRSNVSSIKYHADYDVEFAERLGKLDATDIKGRIALAREAFDQRRYDLAREATHDALRIEPNNREATDFLDLVERQIRLERSGAAPPDRGAPPARAPAPRGAAPPRNLLSADDINTIRQRELTPSDTHVRITLQGDVKKRFADQQNIPFAEFNRLPAVEQAIRIIDQGDADMRRQGKVTSDPASLAEFKRFVQPIVLSQCAGSGCHGGPGAGRLVLYAPADSDPVTYTNFYILTQFQGPAQGPSAAGVFGSSARKMIERGHGDRSLLANFGLPVNIAEYDHPDVGGKPIPPVFRNKQDSRYEQILRWMDKTLSPIAPNYGVDFRPPTAATQPATRPGE